MKHKLLIVRAKGNLRLAKLQMKRLPKEVQCKVLREVFELPLVLVEPKSRAHDEEQSK